MTVDGRFEKAKRRSVIGREFDTRFSVSLRVRTITEEFAEGAPSDSKILATSHLTFLQLEKGAVVMNEEDYQKLIAYLDFRVAHLTKRYKDGEESAYIRLTEVEALKDFVAGNKN